MSRTVLHISDLHFGPPFVPRFWDGVVELAGRLRPDLIVVSGDLTQRARPEQFRQARTALDALAFPKIIVPGNHDVPLYAVHERIFSPFRRYRKYFSAELETVFEDEELFVFGVNTAYNWTLTAGCLTLAKIGDIARRFDRVPAHKFKIVVGHHHFVPPPSFGTQSVLANAYEAIEMFVEHRVDAILSGHLHKCYVGNSADFYPRRRHRIVIAHSGTTTSNRGRGHADDKNTCNVLNIHDDSLEVHQHRWEQSLGRFAAYATHRYPRQNRDPFTLERLGA